MAAHIDFSELETWGAQPKSPVLLLGACNVCTGKLHKFSSHNNAIKIEHLLASSCVPNIFPAVIVEKMAYWDGLFSDNPPIWSLLNRELVGHDNVPQEIWVIKINPTTSDKIPTEPFEIIDRRNEVEGNVSLFQNLRAIEDFKLMFSQGAFRNEFLESLDISEAIRFPKAFAEVPVQPYHIPMIEMSEDLAKSLTYVSKLDRSPEHIQRLILDGEKQGQRFMEARLGSAESS